VKKPAGSDVVSVEIHQNSLRSNKMNFGHYDHDAFRDAGFFKAKGPFLQVGPKIDGIRCWMGRPLCRQA
jgi:hypothetical protein